MWNFQSLAISLAALVIELKISNKSCLAVEISSEKALKLQLTCESHHKMITTEFDSCFCMFQSILLNISNSFLDSDLPFV